jgi:putative membrane protein
MGTIERIWNCMTGFSLRVGGTGAVERICEDGPDGVVCKPPNIWADDRIFFAWQRSHMANERTFLAWSRTSIALLAFGFVIQRFDLFMHQMAQLGGDAISLPTHQGMIYLSFFCFGMAGISAVVSGWRFLAVRRHLNWGMASYSFVPDALVVASVLGIIMVTLALTFPRLLGIGGVSGPG